MTGITQGDGKFLFVKLHDTLKLCFIFLLIRRNFEMSKVNFVKS